MSRSTYTNYYNANSIQASVPFGVMSGYVIAAIMIGPSGGTDLCMDILCWRWPLLVEWAILLPFCIAVFFVPSSHLSFSRKRNKHSSVDDSSSNSRSLVTRRHSIAGTKVPRSYGAVGESCAGVERRVFSPTALIAAASEDNEPLLQDMDEEEKGGTGNGCSLTADQIDSESHLLDQQYVQQVDQDAVHSMSGSQSLLELGIVEGSLVPLPLQEMSQESPVRRSDWC